MMKEKILTIKDEAGREKEVRYYVKQKPKERSDFGCDMYIVGIAEGGEKTEIDDFSPSEKEAETLLEYLYENNISQKLLFSAAEEFITK
jgi:hypothetical protein